MQTPGIDFSVGLLCKNAIPKEQILCAILSFGFDPDPRIFEIHTKIARNLCFLKQTHLLELGVHQGTRMSGLPFQHVAHLNTAGSSSAWCRYSMASHAWRHHGSHDERAWKLAWSVRMNTECIMNHGMIWWHLRASPHVGSDWDFRCKQ